jgi:hypothetical protein
MHRMMRRLVRLERDFSAAEGAGPALIRIRGGLPSATLHAEIGQQSVEQQPGESEADFCDRALAIGADAGVRFVIVGGLGALLRCEEA